MIEQTDVTKYMISRRSVAIAVDNKQQKINTNMSCLGFML